MLALIFECGRVTSSWYAELALRRRVKKSAIGSVIVMTAGSPSSRRFPRAQFFGEAYRNFFGLVCSCQCLRLFAQALIAVTSWTSAHRAARRHVPSHA